MLISEIQFMFSTIDLVLMRNRNIGNHLTLSVTMLLTLDDTEKLMFLRIFSIVFVYLIKVYRL